jgi:hypothetical protein
MKYGWENIVRGADEEIFVRIRLSDLISHSIALKAQRYTLRQAQGMAQWHNGAMTQRQGNSWQLAISSWQSSEANARQPSPPSASSGWLRLTKHDRKTARLQDRKTSSSPIADYPLPVFPTPDTRRPSPFLY